MTAEQAGFSWSITKRQGNQESKNQRLSTRGDCRGRLTQDGHYRSQYQRDWLPELLLSHRWLLGPQVFSLEFGKKSRL